MFQPVALVFLACGIAAAAVDTTTVAGSGELRCQSDNGTLLPSATVCADTLSGCETIFGSSASGTSRPALCDNEDMQDKAAQCAKTCGICCEQPAYDCNDATNAPINCTLNKQKCTASGWLDIMSMYCPATCGFCTSGSCTDAIGGCSSMVALCENIKFNAYMTQNCARTCGTCSSSGTGGSGSGSTCSDIASNCAANANLCNNSVYYSLMTTNCASTCGRCGSSSGGSSCTNANANCATWATNGFCSSTFYTTDQKRQYCASSCGLC